MLNIAPKTHTPASKPACLSKHRHHCKVSDCISSSKPESLCTDISHKAFPSRQAGKMAHVKAAPVLCCTWPCMSMTDCSDLCRKYLSNLTRHAPAQIQRMGATHWLHPTAVMLACLYQSLRAGPFQRRGLMKLLQEHMGLIHLVGPFPAEVGSHNMPPITPYLHSEQVLIWLPLSSLCTSLKQCVIPLITPVILDILCATLASAFIGIRCMRISSL